MSPERVPAEWVEVAAAVLRDSRLVNVCGDGRGCRCEEAVEYSLVSAHDMLAAVLPEAMAEAVESLAQVHERYFNTEVDAYEADEDTAREDIWRFDRDFREALARLREGSPS